MVLVKLKIKIFLRNLFVDFFKKWLWCSWRKHPRCYDQNFKTWHCYECIRCGQFLDDLIELAKSNNT